MKKAQRVMYKFVVGFALIVITFWGCKDELNKTGFNLLLPGDLISAKKITVDKASIKAFTVLDDNVRTNKPTFNLLGTYNDSIFGKSTTDFAAQFRVGVYHDFKGAFLDSIKLTLLYNEIYGDTTTAQSLKVYELNSDLNGADNFIYYNKDVDLKGMAKSEVLAEIKYVPKFKLDSLTATYGSTNKVPKDTILREISFKLNNSLGDYLMAADSLQRSNNDDFLKYFKGLYIEAGDLNSGGSIMRVKTLASGSKLKLFTHHTEIINNKDSIIKDTVIYRVNSTPARTSHFVHDYTTSKFATNLNHTQGEDSLIYLQTTGGLGDKIYIPSLSTWKDSANCAINKAELIFDVEKSAIDTMLLPPPAKILLSLIDATGNIYVDPIKQTLIDPSDVALGDAYYGGYYNVLDGTYRFNLANHLQDIIKGLKGNYGFYLSTDNKNAIFRRLVLKGATSKKGIRFEISYSKLK